MARATRSFCTAVVAMALFSRCHVTATSSSTATAEQDGERAERGFVVVDGEAMAQNEIGALVSIQKPTWDIGPVEGRTKGFIITNFGLKELSRDVQSPTFLRVLQPPQSQEARATSDEQVYIKERRGTDEQIPIEQKGSTKHNCMLGRIYRPCWQN